MPDSNPLQTYRTSIFDKQMPFGIAVAKNWVNGVQGIYKFGRNPSASSAAEDVWDVGGLYTWLSSAQTVTIRSSDAGDSDGGAGARTMQVYGLNDNGLEINESVNLAGTDAVTLNNAYWRLNRMKVLTAGSDETNIGPIYATSTDGTVMAQINAGNGQTLMAIYTIPANKIGHLVHSGLTMGAASKSAIAKLFMRDSTGAWQVKHTDEVVEGESEHDYGYFPEIAGKTDIRWETALAAGQTNEVSADFTIYLFEADS